MFTKKSGPEPSKLAGATSSGTSSFSVLGADISIKGDISASADLHVDGRIEGDIACAALVQGETSEVAGSVSAESARLAGSVNGSIDVRELVILKTAHVHGDVQYDSLMIEQGAVIEGQLSPRSAAQSKVSTSTGENELAGPGSENELLILSEPAE